MSAEAVEINVTEGFVVRPGDTLIVRIGFGTHLAAVDELRAAVLKRIPDLADVVVVTADGLAVYRPNEAADPPPDPGVAEKRPPRREVTP